MYLHTSVLLHATCIFIKLCMLQNADDIMIQINIFVGQNVCEIYAFT